MSLLRQLEASNAAERRGADPTLPWGSSYIPTNGQIGFVAAGVPMNDDMALSITTVYGCVRLLADSVSNMDFVALKKTKDKSRRVLDPQPAVIADPYPEGTQQDFLTQVVVSLALRGNSFNLITGTDSRGYATGLMPVHPDRVTAYRDRFTGERVYMMDGKRVPTSMMVHIPRFTMPGGFIGLNPIEYARGSWALAAAAEKYAGQFFANSANPSGVITVEEDLDEEETLEMARAWTMRHGGIGNAQMPAVLTGGAKWTQISVNPNDAQFIEGRQASRIEIMSWFGIPPHMLGDVDRTTSWGVGVEQQEIGFAINTLQSYTSRIEKYFSKFLLPGQQMAKFDYMTRLRGDTLQRFQAYTLARSGGWLNVDEIRDREDMPPVPGGAGQNYLQPMNMAPLGYDPSKGGLPKPGSTNPSGAEDGGGSPGNSPPTGDPGSV